MARVDGDKHAQPGEGDAVDSKLQSFDVKAARLEVGGSGSGWFVREVSSPSARRPPEAKSPPSIISPSSRLEQGIVGHTMGTGGYSRKKRASVKVKKYKKKKWLSNRAKDTDQIQDEIEKAERTGTSHVEYDDDLPGGGQFYCIETGKHFADANALAAHKKSRYYKRRCKELKEEKYTQEMAEWAAGMTKERLPPAHAKPKS